MTTKMIEMPILHFKETHTHRGVEDVGLKQSAPSLNKKAEK